jgi:REP element-mobilizing transposase RayT
MPRKARILVPNYLHHIVQRGHNRNAVFLGDQDYQYYLENLREWKKVWVGVQIIAISYWKSFINTDHPGIMKK